MSLNNNSVTFNLIIVTRARNSKQKQKPSRIFSQLEINTQSAMHLTEFDAAMTNFIPLDEAAHIALYFIL